MGAGGIAADEAPAQSPQSNKLNEINPPEHPQNATQLRPPGWTRTTVGQDGAAPRAWRTLGPFTAPFSPQRQQHTALWPRGEETGLQGDGNAAEPAGNRQGRQQEGGQKAAGAAVGGASGRQRRQRVEISTLVVLHGGTSLGLPGKVLNPGGQREGRDNNLVGKKYLSLPSSPVFAVRHNHSNMRVFVKYGSFQIKISLPKSWKLGPILVSAVCVCV